MMFFGDSPLRLHRQLEESAHLLLELAHQTCVDAVVDDLEEAPVGACGGNLRKTFFQSLHKCRTPTFAICPKFNSKKHRSHTPILHGYGRIRCFAAGLFFSGAAAAHTKKNMLSHPLMNISQPMSSPPPQKKSGLQISPAHSSYITAGSVLGHPFFLQRRAAPPRLLAA